MTLQSSSKNLPPVGFSSINELEVAYNSLLCHLLLFDKNNTFKKLNELQRVTPKKYAV